MDGLSFVLFIEQELKNKKIPKGTFYSDTGISSATFSQWRKNIYSPSSENIRKIEEYFGVKVTLGQEKKPALKNENELDDTTKELVELAYELDDADRQMLLEMARSIRRRREG